MPNMKKWMWLVLPIALSANCVVSTMASAAFTQDQTSCPSQNFETFLTAFMDSAQVQKAHTSRPLESTSIDPNAEPEPAPVTTQLDGAALKFPVMPTSKKQKADGLVRRISKLADGGMEVMLVKPDTDYQLSFSFRKESCWQLYKMQDDSL
ncbi:hypothetical protein HGP17_23765 [Rhizobium sp. P38BS-XIX]|uniref:hypothetical protein n=1 Tax=Rhizobium sp. P38BS-XIX TaxID=2726740 RepID=UPI0014566365|nr:hypothetical protein [Rhizobium sp. P38BS-XIX]NLR99850.1 hypothetical protein [Rhizobium sp. P38BS-XIX]